MTTLIKPELSSKNKYWIDRHRYYELKHFCLQYPSWKKSYADISNLHVSSVSEQIRSNISVSDLTAKCAIEKARYSSMIKLVEHTVIEADEDLYLYLLKAVTEGLSYTHLENVMGIPCARNTYYDRYRRFFWLLNKVRD